MEIRTTGNGGMEISYTGFPHATRTLTPETADALREHFQAERDATFGWWRWPEHPHYLVKRNTSYDGDVNGRCVTVMLESTGYVTRDWENIASSPAAIAFFDAHPLPKPWQSAEPGEVWLITALGKKPEPMIATTYGTFTAELSEYSINDELITAGRRLWPTGGDDHD